MADSTTFHRFVLTMQSPWNLPGSTVHDWHCKFSVSGTITMTDTDAEATALELWTPIQDCVSSSTSLIAFDYYPSGSTVSTEGKTYAPGLHAGTQSAYIDKTGAKQQLEVCILARAAVGKNTLGKQVYLRKWIHDVLADPTDPNAIYGMTSPSSVLGAWNQGSGPHSVVPVDPTGGEQGGPWTFETHLYTHQLRRGPRRKKAAIVTDSLGEVLKDLAALKTLLPDIGSAA
jgi:hypothetical protein